MLRIPRTALAMLHTRYSLRHLSDTGHSHTIRRSIVYVYVCRGCLACFAVLAFFFVERGTFSQTDGKSTYDKARESRERFRLEYSLSGEEVPLVRLDLSSRGDVFILQN